MSLADRARHSYRFRFKDRRGRKTVRSTTLRLAVSAVVIAAGFTPALAAGRKFFAYNMTTRTDFKEVYLAPAGSTEWRPNQTLNDPDKSLDTTERLTLTGLKPAHYDVKLVAEDGRTCIMKNVDLTRKNSFLIKEADLKSCGKA